MRKGTANLLSGLFIGGFYSMLFMAVGLVQSTIQEYKRSEWDKEYLSQGQSAPAAKGKDASDLLIALAGTAIAGLAGAVLLAGFVAVLGFFGGRRWEAFVLVFLATLGGTAVGLILAAQLVAASFEHELMPQTKYRILIIVGLLGAFFGAFNGAFFAVGVRRFMARLAGELDRER